METAPTTRTPRDPDSSKAAKAGAFGIVALGAIAFALLIGVHAYADTHNVVMADVSGSIGGYGWQNANNYDKAKKQIISFTGAEENVVVVPFASQVLNPITDADSLLIAKGNTNLYNVLEYAFKHEKKKGDTYNFFFLTDGKHNTGQTCRDLSSLVTSIKAKADTSSVWYYFVPLDESARNSQFAEYFDGSHHFTMLDSLALPTRASTVSSENDVMPVENIEAAPVKAKKSIALPWLFRIIIFVLLLMLFAALFYFLLRPLLNIKRSDLSLPDKGNLKAEMKTNPLLRKRIRESKKNISRWAKAQRKQIDEFKLAKTDNGRRPVNSEYAGSTFYFAPGLNPGLRSKLQKGNAAYLIGTYEGGEKYYYVDNKGTARKMGLKRYQYKTVKEMVRKYPNGIPFGEDGLPDFSSAVLKDVNTGERITVCLPGGLTGNRIADQNMAQKIAEEKGMDPIHSGSGTWHHEPRTSNLSYVDFWVHSIVKHSGGIAITQANN